LALSGCLLDPVGVWLSDRGHAAFDDEISLLAKEAGYAHGFDFGTEALLPASGLYHGFTRG